MSALHSGFRSPHWISLHRAVWSHWLISEPHNIGPATFTPRDVAAAQLLIKQGEATLPYAEATELRMQWDALRQRICEANGLSFADGYDVAFSPYGERFMLVKWPPLGRRTFL